MSLVHPLLHAATKATNAAVSALNQLITDLEKVEPPQFLSAIAINFWSPYLPYGRHTELRYPKTETGDTLAARYGGEKRLKEVHRHYLTLIGRNLSTNHLLVEVPKVDQIVVDGTQSQLKGPTIENDARRILRLDMPLRRPDVDQCFNTLLPQKAYKKWLGWIADEFYEQRYQGRLREELLESRLEARGELPDAFLNHLLCWIKNDWVPPHIGLGDFDRWLARIQLTALAAGIWGHIWISHTLSLGGEAQQRLDLLASCTVTGRAIDDATPDVDSFRTKVANFAQYCSQRLQALVQEEFRSVAAQVAELDSEPWEDEISVVADQYSHELGGSLIGAKHEGESVSLRGVLTPGLDALRVGPTELIVLHEIAQAEFGPLDPSQEHVSRWWNVWKAYFASNDLFLGRERVALHFELTLTADGGAVLPVPRHVVQIARPLECLLEEIGKRPAGLLQIGFQTDEGNALHFRSVPGPGKPAVESRVQTKEEYRASKNNMGPPFAWRPEQPAQPEWGALRDALVAALNLILRHKAEPFLKNAASSLTTLKPGQRLQLADGVVEVRRLKRGCLVFIGPVYQRSTDNTYWFLEQSTEKCLEITRLALAFGIVSQIPDTFSEDFRRRFADSAGMDGETVIFTTPLAQSPPEGFRVDRPPGSVETGRFVQLAQDTPALLDVVTPYISREYNDAWERAANCIKRGYLPSPTGVMCRTVSDLEPTELLSLGTRHRKAAMVTKCVDSILAITCSASGKVKLWVSGVPIAELSPHAEDLLPTLSRPQHI